LAALQQILGKTWLFADLSETELDRLCLLARKRTFEPRDVVVEKGAPATELYVILEGRAKAAATGSGGTGTVFNIMAAGELFGEIAVLDGGSRSATVVAIDRCEMAVIDKRCFRELLDASPAISVKVLTVLARRLRRLSEQVEDRAFMDVASRLAKRLTWLADSHGCALPSGDTRLELSMSQQELGELISATRESVNKHLRRWTRDGLLRQERDALIIHDLERLRAIGRSERTQGT
jgi:CRP-like cAMP-binding protein